MGGLERLEGTGTACPGANRSPTSGHFSQLPQDQKTWYHRHNADVVSSFSLCSFPKEPA